VAILVRVTEREHAADLATNVQYADDDVAVLADDEMPRWAGALRKYERAKPRGQLDVLIATARRRDRRRLMSSARAEERGRCGESDQDGSRRTGHCVGEGCRKCTRRWNGGTVVRWYGGTVERWNELSCDEMATLAIE
jgi:hypothetical protein